MENGILTSIREDESQGCASKSEFCEKGAPRFGQQALEHRLARFATFALPFNRLS